MAVVILYKISAFWKNIPERKRQWGLLMVAFIILILVSDIQDSVNAFLDGFHFTERGHHKVHFSEMPKYLQVGSFTGFILGTAFGIFLLMAIGSLIGFAFYELLFKSILESPNKKSVIIFIMVILILENVFHDLFYWFFLKTNALEGDVVLSKIRSYASTAITFVLIVFIIAYGLIKNSFKSKEEQALLLQQKAAAEIQALKAQINPHFLFNTLNNLYGTAIVEDSPKTAGGIQQLAGIMRHAVEGSKNDKIGVDKEIKFLHDYIEIQKIRLPDLATISVNYEINWDEQSAEIAPLILMTFIENAFKYGISTNQESFVNILLTIDNQQLKFSCSNSIVQRTQIETGTETGIDNTRKRLELLYPEKHSLQILEEENEFNVRLTMNLT